MNDSEIRRKMMENLVPRHQVVKLKLMHHNGTLLHVPLTYTNQVVKMLRARGEQQLVASNLQPTNLLFNHNT